MNIKEIFPDRVLIADCVPIGIPDLGFVYMNDIGVWNITINSKSSACNNKTITIAQLLELFQHASSGFAGAQKQFEQELPVLVSEIQKFHEKEIITFL